MKNKGVTLITLIVTIVILLILAGITIGTLTGENGIIKNSKATKEQTEIANEKESLEQAVVKAMGEGNHGNIEVDNLEKEIKNIVGEGKTKVIGNVDTLVVKFLDSNRYYEINNEGNISEPIIIKIDENVGDFTKGSTCDGSEEKPYEINCIEDLVAFSKAINNNEIKQTSHVILMRTLNFKSIFSYGNYETKYSYDESIRGYIEDETSNTTLMELCNNDQRIYSNRN